MPQKTFIFTFFCPRAWEKTQFLHRETSGFRRQLHLCKGQKNDNVSFMLLQKIAPNGPFEKFSHRVNQVKTPKTATPPKLQLNTFFLADNFACSHDYIPGNPTPGVIFFLHLAHTCTQNRHQRAHTVGGPHNTGTMLTPAWPGVRNTPQKDCQIPENLAHTVKTGVGNFGRLRQ